MGLTILICSISFLYSITYGQEIEQKNQSASTENIENEKSQKVVNQSQEEPQNNDNEKIKNRDSIRILDIIILSLLILVLVIRFWPFDFNFNYKENLREYIIEQVLESRRVEDKFSNKEKNKSILTKPYTLTEKDINEIADKVLKYKRLSESDSKEINVENNVGSNNSYRYLKGKSGNIFNRAEYSPNNSFFRLINETEETAQFEFFGDQAEAIAKRIFSEDISNIVSGNYQSAQSVLTIKPGIIRRLGEQWAVIQPIQIKLI